MLGAHKEKARFVFAYLTSTVDSNSGSEYKYMLD
jgi:hypothetical protein